MSMYAKTVDRVNIKVDVKVDDKLDKGLARKAKTQRFLKQERSTQEKKCSHLQRQRQELSRQIAIEHKRAVKLRKQERLDKFEMRAELFEEAKEKYEAIKQGAIAHVNCAGSISDFLTKYGDSIGSVTQFMQRITQDTTLTPGTILSMGSTVLGMMRAYQHDHIMDWGVHLMSLASSLGYTATDFSRILDLVSIKSYFKQEETPVNAESLDDWIDKATKLFDTASTTGFNGLMYTATTLMETAPEIAIPSVLKAVFVVVGYLIMPRHGIKFIVGAIKDIGMSAKGALNVQEFIGAAQGWLVNAYYVYIHGETDNTDRITAIYSDYPGLVTVAKTLQNSDFKMEWIDSHGPLATIIIDAYNRLDEIVTDNESFTSNLQQAGISVKPFIKMRRDMLKFKERAVNSPARTSKKRMEPYCVYLYGVAGCGKSSVFKKIRRDYHSEFADKRRWTTPESCSFSRKVTTKYWDGYNGHPLVTYDDFGQMKDSQNCPNEEFYEMISAANVEPFALKMAECSLKKNSYFGADLIIATSNTGKPRIHSLVEPDAVYRRFNSCFVVDVNDEVDATTGKYKFARDDRQVDGKEGTNGLILDSAKVQALAIQRGVAYIDDAVRYIPYDMRLSTPSSPCTVAVPSDSGHTLKSELTETEFRAYLIDQQKKHREEHQRKSRLEGDLHDEGETIQLILDAFKAESLEDTPTSTTETQKDQSLKGRFFASLRDLHMIHFVNKPEVDEDVFEDCEDFDDGDYCLSERVKTVVKEKANTLLEFATSTYDAAKATALPLWEKFVALAKKHLTPMLQFLRNLRNCFTVPLIATTIITMLFKIGVIYAVRKACRIFTHDWFHPSQCNCGNHGCMVVNRPRLSNMTIGSVEFEAAVALELLGDPEVCKEIAKQKDAPSRFQRLASKIARASMEHEAQGYEFKARIAAKAQGYELKPRTAPKAQGYEFKSRSVAKAQGYELKPRSTGKMSAEELYYETVPHNVYDNGRLVAQSGDTVMVEQHARVSFHNGVLLETNEAGNYRRTNAVMVSGVTLLHNAHWDPSTTFTVLFPGSGIKHKVLVSECKRSNFQDIGTKTDLAFTTLPARFAPSRSILPYLVEAKDRGVWSADDSLLTTYDLQGSTPVVHQYSSPITNQIDNYTYDHNGKSILAHSTYWYDASTFKGACGGLLWTRHKSTPGKIIGMHAAGDGSRRGLAITLTRELVTVHLAAHTARYNLTPRFTLDATHPVQAQSYKKVTEKDLISDETYCKIIGKTDRGINMPTGTKIRKSLAYGMLGASSMLPAALKRSDQSDPMAKGLRKVLGPQQPLPNSDLIRDAASHVLDSLTFDSGLREPLTYMEAVKGSDRLHFNNGLNRRTSPGFPYTLQNPDHGKRFWFGEGEEWKDGGEVKEHVMQLLEDARNNVRGNSIFTASLKDERRPIEKVLAGKTRVFEASPQHFSVACRMYFGGVIDDIMYNRIDNSFGVGTNVYSLDWHKTAMHLQQHPNTFAGDFSNFDGSQHQELLWYVLDIINAWYSNSTITDIPQSEDNKIREVLFSSMCASDVIVDNVFIRQTHSQPSGNALTVIINCIFNKLVMTLAYLDAKKDLGEACHNDFNTHVAMQCYGDDNVLSVSDAMAPYYNQATVTEILAKYGLTYTDECKTGQVTDFRPFADVAYLKRKFEKDQYGIYRAPISLETIREMTYYVKTERDLPTFTITNIQMALFELALHGRTKYLEAYHIWKPLVTRLKTPSNFDKRLPTYEEQMALHAKASRLDVSPITFL